LLVFSRPWSRDHIPTPPRAMTKLFDRHLCTNCAENWR
jgi:hypothetical protein